MYKKITMKKFSFIFSLIVGILFLSNSSINAQNSAGVKKVMITTSYGTIKIKLYNETPKHRDNFIKLATSGYLNGTLFHRVIQGFMIQGGDPDSKTAKAGAMLGAGGPGYTVPAEFNAKLIHKKGALAAARDNNPQKASSGSQFYIVQGRVVTDAELDNFQKNSGWTYTKEQRNIYKTSGGTPSLDNGYTVFGEVYEGLDVIDKIAAVKKGANDRPAVDVKMTVKIIK